VGCTQRELWPPKSASPAGVRVAIRYRSPDSSIGRQLEAILGAWCDDRRRLGVDPAHDLRGEPRVEAAGPGTWDVVFEGQAGSDAWHGRLVEFGVVAARRSPSFSSAFLVDRATGEERPTFFEA
jgi:hypothetical protein